MSLALCYDLVRKREMNNLIRSLSCLAALSCWAMKDKKSFHLIGSWAREAIHKIQSFQTGKWRRRYRFWRNKERQRDKHLQWYEFIHNGCISAYRIPTDSSSPAMQYLFCAWIDDHYHRDGWWVGAFFLQSIVVDHLWEDDDQFM